MILLTELGDISRFKGLGELCSYSGIAPNCHNSGETEHTEHLSKRGNATIKRILVDYVHRPRHEDIKYEWDRGIIRAKCKYISAIHLVFSAVVFCDHFCHWFRMVTYTEDAI